MIRAKAVSALTAGLLAVAFLVGMPQGGQADAAARDIAVTTHDEAFVVSAYTDFLGREPTEEELAAATESDLDTEPARYSIVDDLSHSPEWIATTVEKLYQDTLGRPGDETGTAFWIEVLSSGELTVAQAAANFYSSDEYFEGFGNSDVTEWVTDIYTKVLLREPEQEGIDYWVEAADLRGRWWVASAMYQSEESCRTRVNHLYNTLLGRDPDPGGWGYWADRVNEDGDLVLAAFLASSDEYYQKSWDRFGTGETTTTSEGETTTTTGDETTTTAETTTTTAPPAET